MNENTFVSIVVPALNEEKCIGKCLDALTSINFPRNSYEIILVDNGSTDNTVSIAKKFGIKVLQRPGVTISALRNIGAREAKGNVLAFVDADCIVSRDWMKNALPYFKDEKIGVIGSFYQHPDQPHWIEKTWYSQLRGLNHKGPVSWLAGGNIITTRKCFESVNGFNEEMRTTEDVDLCNRITQKGYTIFSDPMVRVVHLGNPKTLKHFMKRELWYSQDALKKFINHLPRITNLSVILFALIYSTCMLLLPVTMLFGILRGSFLWFGLVCAFFFMVPLTLAARSTARSGRYELFFGLYVLYFVYGLARGFSVLNPKNW